MGCSRQTGDEASPGRARVCEAVRKNNICEYAVTYDDDLVQGKVGEGGKCGGSASIGWLECGVE